MIIPKEIVNKMEQVNLIVSEIDKWFYDNLEQDEEILEGTKHENTDYYGNYKAIEQYYQFADEPTGNLDPETGKGIMELLYSISQAGMTVIMSTHNPVWPELYPGRKLQFADGKITEM